MVYERSRAALVRGCRDRHEAGVADFRVSYIDPFESDAVLAVGPNWSALGVGSSTVAGLSCELRFVKKQWAQVSAALIDGRSVQSLPVVAHQASEILKEAGYTVSVSNVNEVIPGNRDDDGEPDLLLRLQVSAAVSKHPRLSLFHAVLKSRLVWERPSTRTPPATNKARMPRDSARARRPPSTRPWSILGPSCRKPFGALRTFLSQESLNSSDKVSRFDLSPSESGGRCRENLDC